MTWLRNFAAAALLAAMLGTASNASAVVFQEQGDAGGSASPQATIGGGPLTAIQGTIGELLPAAPGGFDLVDAFTFVFVAEPDPAAPGLLLPAKFDIFAEIEAVGLPAVQLELRLLAGDGSVHKQALGDGSVRIAGFEFLPAVQRTIFHIELAIGEAIDPPYTITFLTAGPGHIAPLTPVPEPESFILLGAALIGLGLYARMR